MRCLLLTGFLLASTCVASADEISVAFVKSKDITADDIPLDFVVQKVNWTRSNTLRIWGKVTNATNTPFRYARITLTALDADGKFLGRQQAYFDPKVLGPGHSAFVDGVYIETEGRKPTTVEYGITGEVGEELRVARRVTWR
jgi:hypothetical protein